MEMLTEMITKLGEEIDVFLKALLANKPLKEAAAKGELVSSVPLIDTCDIAGVGYDVALAVFEPKGKGYKYRGEDAKRLVSNLLIMRTLMARETLVIVHDMEREYDNQ